MQRQNEEIAEVLFAISVVAKRLARKLSVLSERERRMSDEQKAGSHRGCYQQVARVR